MTTLTEQHFNLMVKEVYHDILKPLGYKKKGNNFYLAGEIGKIVNLQKSIYNSKGHIKFTVNTGIFSDVYWRAYYNFFNKEVPSYPTEPECILRRRIGSLIGVGDQWYELTEYSNINEVKSTQLSNLKNVILPYFDKIQSHEDIVRELNNSNYLPSYVLAKLVMLGELKMLNEAHEEYERLLNYEGYKSIRSAILEKGVHYGLDKM